jgi:hypothetical protein
MVSNLTDMVLMVLATLIALSVIWGAYVTSMPRRRR